MTIEINSPEVEALIQRRLKQGGFKDPQELILHALHASDPSKPASAGRVAALQSSPAQNSGHAPDWLKASWATARESGLDAMTTGQIIEEIDAEIIAAARLARHQPRP